MREGLAVCAYLLTGEEQDIATVPWDELRVAHTTALASRLAERYAPSTARQRIAALRGVLKACWRLDLITEHDYRKAIDIDPVRGDAPDNGRALAPTEIAALLAACHADATITGIRDYAVVALLYNAGLRRSELVSLGFEDYVEHEHQVTIRQGKGRKARTVYLSDDVVHALRAWQRAGTLQSGPFFRAISKAKRVLERGLSDQAIWYILDRRAVQAGIPPVRPHDMRRTTISTLLDQGVDLVTVQRIAGHASPTTTAKYDRRDERAKRAAGGRLNLPPRDEGAQQSGRDSYDDLR
jgi:integrase